MKMATGAGKTTVMAMLIAWHTVNAVRASGSSRFITRFLIITPGITIRDRLRVLQPERPGQLLRHPRVRPARHAAGHRQGEDRHHQLSRLSKARDHGGSKGRPRACCRAAASRPITTETEGADAGARLRRASEPEECRRDQRRGAPLLSRAAGRATAKKRSDGEEKEEAGKNNEAARLWISGIEALKRKLGVRARLRPLRDAVLPCAAPAIARARSFPGS